VRTLVHPRISRVKAAVPPWLPSAGTSAARLVTLLATGAGAGKTIIGMEPDLGVAIGNVLGLKIKHVNGTTPDTRGESE